MQAMMVTRRNAQGRRIGEHNPGAKLRDHEVDLVLALHDEGMSLAKIAEKFEVTKSCIGHIVPGRRRL